MNALRAVSLSLALSLVLATVPHTAFAEQTGSGDPTYQVQNPPMFAMMGDLLVARPLLLVLTALGTGVFVVSLPFTALGGNVKEAGKALVVGPAKATFVRCLGCTEPDFESAK